MVLKEIIQDNNKMSKLLPDRIDTLPVKLAHVFRPLVNTQISRAIKPIIPLIEKDYIEKLKKPTECLTPIRLIKKSYGTDRLCWDLRALNNLVMQDNYLIPKIKTLMDPISGTKYFKKFKCISLMSFQ